MEKGTWTSGHSIKSSIDLFSGMIRRSIETLMVTCLVITTALIFGDVVLRYAPNSEINISEVPTSQAVKLGFLALGQPMKRGYR